MIMGLLGILAVVIAVFIIAPNLSQGIPVGPSDASYKDMRNRLIGSETARRIGGTMNLSTYELALNDFIIAEKRKMMDTSRSNQTTYYPAISFFHSKPVIDQSSIFKIIQKMPKGASLHLHDLAISSLRWVVENATYRDDVYMCVDSDKFIRLGYFKTLPDKPACPWRLIKTERANAQNQTDFDESIIRNISMLSSDPLAEFPSVDLVWTRFNKYFEQVISLLFHEPIMRDYYRNALEEFKNDNVQYFELRAQMTGFTDDTGTVRDTEFGCKMYKEVTDEFVKENSADFLGAKIIMSGLRFRTKTEILNEVKTAMSLHTKYPNFMMGYDLVGQEDPLQPLLFYLDELLYPVRQDPPFNLPYFFHAGETKWQGTQVDYNLVDALLLNTTRIGHGYALPKHPELAKLVKERGIAVEVNPISNQLLGLVNDIRNHPMTNLMADNFPIVVSSDDPGTWESAPLSHDIFMAFMAMSGEDADLTFLKQLAINSIQYSVMNTTEKQAAMNFWQQKWDKFIEDAVKEWVGPLPSAGSTVLVATSPAQTTKKVSDTATRPLYSLPWLLLLPLSLASYTYLF